MWNILKTAVRREKGAKSCDSGPRVYMCRGAFYCPDWLTLVCGHSVHFTKFLILRFLKRSYSPNFIQYHPNIIQGITVKGQYRLLLCLAICQKQTNKQTKQTTNKQTPPQKKTQQQQQHIKTKLWHIDFFLNTGPYETGNFKVLFLPQFSLKPIQFVRTMVTVTNLNAC